jgi:hypothetical protein
LGLGHLHYHSSVNGKDLQERVDMHELLLNRSKILSGGKFPCKERKYIYIIYQTLPAQ